MSQVYSISSTKVLHNPTWYRALTLVERLALLPTQAEAIPALDASHAELAARRLQRWKEQKPFDTVSFKNRLSMDSLSEEVLLYLLGEPDEALQKRIASPPDWLCSLELAFADVHDIHSFVLPDSTSDQESNKLRVFMQTLKPLLKQGFDRLQQGVDALAQRYTYLPFDPEAITGLLYPNLVERIIPRIAKVMTIELNIARLEGRLHGQTPAERFSSFVQKLCQPDAMLSLLSLYPVLARDLVTIIKYWANFGIEVLTHLCTDWNEIRYLLPPDQDPGILTSIKCGAGDAHRQGRSTVVLRFATDLQLLYKPKSLAIDIHFQELLTWLNTRGEHLARLPFRTLKLINKGTYGWSEFIVASECSSQAEVERFYERQGGYLALLYALDAVDFHFENLIASGEHPFLIDLEALFHPHMKKDEEAEAAQRFETLGIHALDQSVLRTGLLPRRIQGPDDDSPGIDLSGLGGHSGQMTTRKYPFFTDIGTDEMHIVRQRFSMPGRNNRPVLNGADINILDYTEQIVSGFSAVYTLFMEHREELLTEILPRFAHDEIRLILRPTMTYGRFLDESCHPYLLHNTLDRDRFYDHLWSGLHQFSYFSQVVPAERADLHNNDVPLFTTSPNSYDVYGSQGQCIMGFLKETGQEMVRKRIIQLDRDDLAKQMWFIRASFATVQLGSEQPSWRPSQLQPPQTKVTHERLLHAARAVGNRLCELALRSEDEVSWIGLSLVKEREWSLVQHGPDLYNGAGGVILFLAYLGNITGETRYTTLARLAWGTMQRQIERIKSLRAYSQPYSLGIFNGLGACLYLYAHLGRLWNEPELFTQAAEIIDYVTECIDRDKAMDLMAGSAGCIRALLCLYSVTPSPNTLKTAIACGNHLVAHAQLMERGVGWITPLGGEKALVGYSHGAAGIAHSLLELAAVSGEERFRQTALAAIEYERSVFSPEKQNWPDLRPPEVSIINHGPTKDEVSYMTTWCHGAPGVGLSRLASLQYVDDAAMREEITIALQTTLAQGFGLNHSLCHGDLGNLEVLLTATLVLGDARYSEEVQRLAAMILESIETHGWSTGAPLSVETPGLMTGIAGIGYELLRLAEPQRIPSIMVLAAPPTHHA